MSAIVTLVGGRPVTTTPAVADGTGVDHASVIKLVRTYRADLEEFGGVGFEIQPFNTAGGTQQREIACLNEQQATLLMTYMRSQSASVSASRRTAAWASEVNPAKTRLRFNGLVPSDAGGTIRLVNSTTIEVDATGNASAGKVAYELEETY